jgi:hypothetical protein
MTHCCYRPKRRRFRRFWHELTPFWRLMALAGLGYILALNLILQAIR